MRCVKSAPSTSPGSRAHNVRIFPQTRPNNDNADSFRVSCGLRSPGALGEQAEAVEADDDGGALVPGDAQRQRQVSERGPR